MVKFTMIMMIFFLNQKIINEIDLIKELEYQILITILAFAYVNISIFCFKYFDLKRY